MILARFENDEPLGRGNEDDFPGDKGTEPLQKVKQIKNQIDPKKKKRAKIQAVTHFCKFGKNACGAIDPLSKQTCRL